MISRLRTLFWGAISLLLLCGNISVGQVGQLPGFDYYQAFPEFYAADYQDALKRFIRGGNSAFKIGTERFMDSVCYWTMAGECYYHQGNYAEALAYYEQALELTSTYVNGSWQERIQPKPLQAVQRSLGQVQKAQVTWHQTKRGGDNVAIIQDFAFLFGRLDAARAIVEGGPIQNPEFRKVDHAEIVRCIALALYRRYSIRGVASHIDPNTTKYINDFGQLSVQTPILGEWNLALKGLANFSAGRNAAAVKELQASLKLSNGLDHVLTPIALLALGKIALQEGNQAVAANMALEASYSAAVYEQFDLVEESLAFGNLVHLLDNKTPYPPLPAVIKWSSRDRRSRLTQTSMLLRLSDGLIESGNAEQARKTLVQAKQSIRGTTFGRSKYAGQLNYLNAAMSFLQKQDGYAELRRALEQFQTSSLWLFRLRLVGSSLAAGSITQRQAELMYEQLLLDPNENHWKVDPMETVAYSTSSHVEAMERWLEIVLARKNYEKAIEISERIRRHRFYESLPMAGRLMAIRWMLTAPDELLAANALKQKTEFLARFPEFAESQKQIASLNQQLKALPLNPKTDSDEYRRQRDLFVELLKVSKLQEAVINSRALTRQPADFVFPALMDYSGISKNLKDYQVIIASLRTAAGYHQFAVTQNSRRYLGVIRDRDMRRAVAKFYKALGITDANGAIDSSTLTSTEWKKAAAELKSIIFENFHDDQWSSFKELVIVPDGILWYVPFEILQTGDAEADWKNLSETIKMRYLPMMAMVSSSNRPPAPDARIAVVTGKMHLKGDLELTNRGFEKLTDEIQNASQYNRQVKIPSNLTNSVTDAMMIWHDSKVESKTGPFGLTPFFLDRGKDGSTLGSWLKSPWLGCKKVIMPAFSSSGAAGLKSKSTGMEMFLTTCGMMASGTRSILISRWRPGGENSIELSRQYLVNSQNMSSVEALEASTKSTRELDLNLDNEIRVKPSRKLQGTFKADHPFFWAGNMLVDLNGYIPPVEVDQADVKDDADTENQEANDNPSETTDTDKPEKAEEPDTEPESEPGDGKEKSLLEKAKEQFQSEGSDKKESEKKEGSGRK